MKHQPFRTTLSAAATYQLGDPILITFDIENTGTEAYQVLKWGTPLEKRINDDFLIVRRDGETLRYDGKFVKRGDPAPQSYVIVEPGERLSETVDISTAYQINEPGEYTATLRFALHDVYPLATGAKVAPRKRQSHEPHALEASSVKFTVVAGTQPKRTEGELAREDALLAKSSPKARTPDINGGTSTQQSDTITAHNNAQYFAALSASQLDNTDASSNALYQEWFGAFDQSRYDKVTKHFADISSVLASEQVTYEIGSSDCESDWYAFTYSGARTVWLCNVYLSAPQIGTDCKFGTLIHEWSHAICDTEDWVYGQSNCRNLATTDTGKAIDNADSHEYFAEHLAQSDYGKSFTFITDRSTFGRDEVDAMLLQGSPAVVPQAFYVLADGFWPSKLGITSASLGQSPNVKPAISLSPSIAGMNVTVAAVEAEDVTLPEEPQRFTWVLQVSFTNNSGFPTAPGQTQLVTLTASMLAYTCSAQIRLICEPNPYELDGPVSWLSTDVRVFQIRAGESRFGATIGSSATSAPTFIQQAVANLNSGNSGGQTFEGISLDPSVSALELSQQVNGTNVFNFAVAKVRYRGTIDISNVRVFFRLFPVSTTSIDFDQNTTYRRATQNADAVPLLGLNANGDLRSIPCFAERRIDSSTTSMTEQIDPTNVRTIPHDASGREVAAYFGCWLDINQTQPQFPTHPSPGNGPWTTGRKTIQELIRNAHQCLVAEIAFDPDPIPAGASPSGSDKLAQRNLSIVASANPGQAASRRILNVFELHPPVPVKVPRAMPDELMIDWGNIPRASVATIYIPEIDMEQIISLANERYAKRTISRIDGQTIRVEVGGISYLPLPPSTAFGLTGLLTIDLPGTVRKGEVYTVVVRQVTDAEWRRIPVSSADGSSESATGAATTSLGDTKLIQWRRIVGSYQITVPVRTKEVILPDETRLLSVLKWILASISSTDRWYPVFSRYVQQIGERVGALGGDPGRVQASPSGAGGESIEEPADIGPGRRHEYCGKVVGIVYDCFGDFGGFLLDDCSDEIAFQAREHQIEGLVRTAWRERIAITVVTSSEQPRRPISIVLRRAPEPFQA